MSKDAYSLRSGNHHLFQAPFCTFSKFSWLTICLVTFCSTTAVEAQYSNDASTAARSASRSARPVQPRKSNSNRTTPLISQRASATIDETRSIIQPANHQELIIPNAMEVESEDGGSLYAVEGESFTGSDNVYDFVTDRCKQGSRHYFLDWSRAELWIGTSGFTNPGNSFVNGAVTEGQVEGSFGFQEGFNLGSQLPGLLSGQVGSQLGMRFIQSNLDGSEVSEGSRNQLFATAGLFRRIDYGFQGGMVVDYLRDQWVYTADLWQLRGELSFLFSPAHELGFRFTDGGRTHRQRVELASGASLDMQLQPMNTYRMFGRRRFGNCAANVVEVQLGTSADGGLLMGCMLQNALSGQIGLETAATYFMPSSVANADTQEAWGLSLALVWTPGRSFGTKRDYNRPLFEVAGNGSFIAARP